MTRDEIFVPEHALLDQREEHYSDDGRYRLTITPYSSRPGAWNCTEGVVYSKDSDDPIVKIRRNYHHFPFLFVNHPNGHYYLVCGEDYQGQTVVELDTHMRREHRPEENGFGFCWASYTFDTASRLMIVDGCFWACPYEFRFFDFSDPMNGWPEVETETYIDAGDDLPIIHPDGTVTCYVFNEDDTKQLVTLKRDGNKFVPTSP